MVLPVRQFQFPEQMRDAETVNDIVVIEIWFPEVVNGFSLKQGEEAKFIEGVATSLVVKEVAGQPARRSDMEPMQRTVSAHSAFVQMEQHR